MQYLNVGTIIKSKGINGEVVIKSNTYFAKKRYKQGNILFLMDPYNNKEVIKVSVKSYYSYKGNDYVLFNEISDVDTANKYKGYLVNINKEDADLEDNEYLFIDLIDCKIIDEDNKELGKVIKVEEFPAQITLRCITKDNKNFFIPFIGDVFIKDVDIKNKVIKIKYYEGML